MFEARMSAASLLKKIVEALKDLVTEGNFDVSASGISLQVCVCVCVLMYVRLYLYLHTRSHISITHTHGRTGDGLSACCIGRPPPPRKRL